MKDLLEGVLQISRKLGWGDMLTQIAIPAIKRIIKNFQDEGVCIAGESCSQEEAIEYMLRYYTADDVFALLFFDSLGNNDPEWTIKANYKGLIAMRPFVEALMREGFSFEKATLEIE